jgi:hypothetical protein
MVYLSWQAMYKVRSSTLPAVVVIWQTTAYPIRTVPPDNHAETVVVVLDEDTKVRPSGTVKVKVEIVSPTANQSDQSHT